MPCFIVPAMLYKLIVWIYHFIMGTKPAPEETGEKSAAVTETDKIINAAPCKTEGLEKNENLA